MKNKLFLLFIIWLLGFSVIFVMREQTAAISSLIYWIILGLIISTIWLFKMSSQLVLLSSLLLFILAGLIATLTFTAIAEKIMRISLLGWIIGFMQATFEYYSKNK